MGGLEKKIDNGKVVAQNNKKTNLLLLTLFSKT